MHHAPMNRTSALAAARKGAGLTQTDLAVAAGLSLPTIQRAERDPSRVSETTWAAISEALGLPVVVIAHAKDQTTANEPATGTNKIATAA